MKSTTNIRFTRFVITVMAAFLLYAPNLYASESTVLRIGAIGLTVSDLDRAVEFYANVLSFQKVSETEFHKYEFDRLTGIFGARVRIATMKLGTETIQLTEYLTPPGRPIPVDSRSHDRWFQHIAIVVSDMDVAYNRLRRAKVKPISTAPQQIPEWNKSAAGIRAFYFRDPDNHPLELINFPPGKGDLRWQRKDAELFLGIDHTAIAVWDTEKNLQFYRDLLGLKVAGMSLNYGLEQELLNHVFGSRVRITGLRAADGPGIEFLEYLAPRDGRPYPMDAKPNDLIHWQVEMVAENATKLFKRFISEGVRFISSEFIGIESLGLGGKKAILVRDPDGHALKLVER